MTTFKTGDRVEVLGKYRMYEGKGTVAGLFDGGYLIDTDGPNRASRSDGYFWTFAHDLTLIDETKTKEGDVMFKVGDKAIVRNLELPMFGFSIGDKVVVSGRSHGERLEITLLESDEVLSGYIGFCDPESLEKIEVTEVTEVIEVGDKVRLKSTHLGALAGFDDGDTVTVYEADRGKPNDLEVGFPGRMLRGFTTSDNVELVEKAPKTEAVPAKFKVGDFVRGTSEDRYTLTTTNMTKGVVTEILDADEISVKILEAKPFTKTEDFIGREYEVDPKHFELATKFQVGDIVRGLPASNTKYSITNENMAKGEVINVDEDGIEVKVLEIANGSYGEGHSYGGLDPEVFELVTDEEVKVAEAPKQGKRYIRMISSSIGFNEGDVLELSEDGRYFIDNDGDQRIARSHKFEEIEGPVSFIEKPTTRTDVVEYLSEISPAELLDIMTEARK